MIGNTLSRSLNAVSHMVRRPDHAGRWIQNRINRKPPIDQGLPWFSYSAIDALAKWLKPGMRVIEWGGGGSTIFFAQHGCSVVTIEHHKGWADKFAQRLRELKLDPHVEIRVVQADDRYPASARAYVEGAGQGGPWDVVVIDGLESDTVSRMACVRHIACNRDLVKPSGIVLLDDAWRSDYNDAPEILSAFAHNIHWGLGPSRFGVTRTDFYWKNG